MAVEVEDAHLVSDPVKRFAVLTLRVLAVLIAGLIVAFVGIIVLAIVFGSGLGDPCPPYC